MRYFKVYRNCCTVRKDEEMKWEDFDRMVWNEAWETAYNATEPYDGEEDDRFLDRVSEEACEVMDVVFRGAESDYGYCAGDYHLYVKDDDVNLWDIPRPN